MNQTYSGLMLLGAVIFIALLLFVVASVIKPKVKPGTTRNKHPNLKINRKDKPMFKSKPGALKSQPNDQLLKLKKRMAKYFPELNTSLRQHHLIIEHQSKKIAMLTLDKTIEIGRRRLGDTVVINFHELPSVKELKLELGI